MNNFCLTKMNKNFKSSKFAKIFKKLEIFSPLIFFSIENKILSKIFVHSIAATLREKKFRLKIWIKSEKIFNILDNFDLKLQKFRNRPVADFVDFVDRPRQHSDRSIALGCKNHWNQRFRRWQRAAEVGW